MLPPPLSLTPRPPGVNKYIKMSGKSGIDDDILGNLISCLDLSDMIDFVNILFKEMEEFSNGAISCNRTKVELISAEKKSARICGGSKLLPDPILIAVLSSTRVFFLIYWLKSEKKCKRADKRQLPQKVLNDTTHYKWLNALI